VGHRVAGTRSKLTVALVSWRPTLRHTLARVAHPTPRRALRALALLLLLLFLGVYLLPFADRAWVSVILALLVVGVALAVALVVARQLSNRRGATTRTRLSWAVAGLFLADQIAIGYAGTHCTALFDDVQTIGILASPVIALTGVALARFRPTWLWIGSIIASPFVGLLVAGVVWFSTESCGR
jgi:hypothetical protein